MSEGTIWLVVIERKDDQNVAIPCFDYEDAECIYKNSVKMMELSSGDSDFLEDSFHIYIAEVKEFTTYQ